MSNALFYPMLAVMGLTFVVGLIMLFSRIMAVKNRKVSVSYFVLVKGSDVPPRLEQLSNNFNNLFALPMLFYVMCITLYVTTKVDSLSILLAWVFFGSRVLHSIIHITYNNVMHRMLAFLIGLVVLLIMFGRLIIAL